MHSTGAYGIIRVARDVIPLSSLEILGGLDSPYSPTESEKSMHRRWNGLRGTLCVASGSPRLCSSQLVSNLPQTRTLRLKPNDVLLIYDSTRTAHFLAAGPSIPYTCAHALSNQVALKLSDGGHNCEKCLSERTAGIDVFLVANELDTERPKFLQ